MFKQILCPVSLEDISVTYIGKSVWYSKIIGKKVDGFMVT
jgi:hypothetical protein